MLKLNASYSKKVPANGEYSSQSYHVSLEVELPDGLTESQLKTKIAQTFELTRKSVEAELGEKGVVQTQKQAQTEPSATEDVSASSKQISFLTSFAKQRGMDVRTLIQKHGVNNLYHLTRRQCTQLIDELKAA